MACSSRGRSPRDRRSIRGTSGSRWKSRTTRWTYGDFEGTIPKGQYGGGTVMLWDRGTWESQSGDPARSLKGGELKFTLHGQKLNGSWVLVRMRHDRTGGKRINWLLIKHRNDAARDAEDITAQDRSVASGRTMEDIAAGKGRGPTPFVMKGNRRNAANASWDSNSKMTSKSSAKKAAPRPARQRTRKMSGRRAGSRHGLQQKRQKSRRRRPATPAGVRRTAALQAGRASACRIELGS